MLMTTPSQIWSDRGQLPPTNGICHGPLTLVSMLSSQNPSKLPNSMEFVDMFSHTPQLASWPSAKGPRSEYSIIMQMSDVPKSESMVPSSRICPAAPSVTNLPPCSLVGFPSLSPAPWLGRLLPHYGEQPYLPSPRSGPSGIYIYIYIYIHKFQWNAIGIPLEIH